MIELAPEPKRALLGTLVAFLVVTCPSKA